MEAEAVDRGFYPSRSHRTFAPAWRKNDAISARDKNSSSMLIVDVGSRGGSAERVGIVGSCRLLAPMHAAVRDNRGRLFRHICRSYTYSAAEARQHLAVCRGELVVPESLTRYILGKLYRPPLSNEWIRAVRSCDTFLVEISTFEDLLSDEFVFNMLGISSHLVRGNGPGILKWYRDLSPQPSSMTTVAIAEKSLKDRGIEVTETIHDIICSLRRCVMDESSFGQALRTIVFDPTKRWIFVPVFDVSEDPKLSIPARAALRNVLRREAAAGGYEFFDPTPIITKAGRQAALEGDGVQPIHYARSFEPTMGGALCHFIARGGRRAAENKTRNVSRSR
jgi:hypothetical protein